MFRMTSSATHASLHMYYAYQCLPKKCGNNPLGLAVLGFIVASFVVMWTGHGIYSKVYSLTLGILVGTQRWLWPAAETRLLGRTVRKTLAKSRTVFGTIWWCAWPVLVRKA
jgi:hypothetical protein